MSVSDETQTSSLGADSIGGCFVDHHGSDLELISFSERRSIDSLVSVTDSDGYFDEGFQVCGRSIRTSGVGGNDSANISDKIVLANRGADIDGHNVDGVNIVAGNVLDNVANVKENIDAHTFGNVLSFVVNGVEYNLRNPDPTLLLVDWLREHIGTGTKIACGEGGCGACTVICVDNSSDKAIYFNEGHEKGEHFDESDEDGNYFDEGNGGKKGSSANAGAKVKTVVAGCLPGKKVFSFNACLRLIGTCDGLTIITVEGLGSSRNFGIVQKAIADGNGSQCGFCTPGWVTAITALLCDEANVMQESINDSFNEAKSIEVKNAKNEPITIGTGLDSKHEAKVIEEALDGNLCRCTGYRPILDAVQELCANSRHTDIEDLLLLSCDNKKKTSCNEKSSEGKNKSRCGVHRSEHTESASGEQKEGISSGSVEREARDSFEELCEKSFTGVEKCKPGLRPLHFESECVDWYRVLTIAQLRYVIMNCGRRTKIKLVTANTGMGVAKYYIDGEIGQPLPLPNDNTSMVDNDRHDHNNCQTTMIDISSLAETAEIRPFYSGLKIGAAVSLTGLIQALEDNASKSEDETSGDDESTGSRITESGNEHTGKEEKLTADDTRRDQKLTSGDDESSSKYCSGSNYCSGSKYCSGDAYAVAARHLRRVANTQVRNVGTWAGNLALSAVCGPNFPSDVLTVFAGLGVTVRSLKISQVANVLKESVKESVESIEKWYARRIGIRKQSQSDLSTYVEMQSDPNIATEVLISAWIPRSEEKSFFAYSDKTAQRHVNSHAIVNCCFSIELCDGTTAVGHDYSCGARSSSRESRTQSCPSTCRSIKSVRMVFGGVCKSGLFVVPMEVLLRCLVGKTFTTYKDMQDTIKNTMNAVEIAARDAGLREDAQNSTAYRISLMKNFIYKFFLRAHIHFNGPRAVKELKDLRIYSAVEDFAAASDRSLSRGESDIDVRDPKLHPVGLKIPKLDARLQASGEAMYTCDKEYNGHLFGAIVFTKTDCLSTNEQNGLQSLRPRILSKIDFSSARKMPGVVTFVTKKDCPNPKASFLVGENELCPHAGCAVGIVLANSRQEARAAALSVKMLYTDPFPDCVVTDSISDRKAGGYYDGKGSTKSGHNSHHNDRNRISSGNDDGRNVEAECEKFTSEEFSSGVEKLFTSIGKRMKLPDQKKLKQGADFHWGIESKNADPWMKSSYGTLDKDTTKRTVRGTFSTSGQKHFYLETNVCEVVPGEEHGTMKIFSSTQAPARTQEAIAKALSSNQSPVLQTDITVIGKRVGGGYGGKLSGHLPTAVLASICSYLHGKPVFVWNDRIDDMLMQGGRSPIFTRYEADYDTITGKITRLDMRLEVDSGYSTGGMGDLGMGIGWSDNCYFTENFKCTGNLLKTRKPDNTACRAPGVPQSIAAHEAVIEHVAFELERGRTDSHGRLWRKQPWTAEEVREINFYQEGQTTPFGVLIGDKDTSEGSKEEKKEKRGVAWNIPTLWREGKKKSGLDFRKIQVNEFNEKNRWRKRGISMIPIKYNFSPSSYMEDCLVSIFADGSISVTHSGCEIGQGINTKVAQAVCYALTVSCASGDDYAMGGGLEIGISAAHGKKDISREDSCCKDTSIEDRIDERRRPTVVSPPLSLVKITETNTMVTPNCTVTGGSGTSETCVKAAMRASRKLARKLTPILRREMLLEQDRREREWPNHSGTNLVEFKLDWRSLVAAAVKAGVVLNASGQNDAKPLLDKYECLKDNLLDDGLDGGLQYEYKTVSPSVKLEDEPRSANVREKQVDYCTYGVGISEVEIDVLTGDVQILKSDLFMDYGLSLNPLIDLGQTQGGFIMSLGMFFSEEMLWRKADQNSESDSARQKMDQVNVGTWNYKIPSALDIPIEFNVAFLSGTRNNALLNILGSKAVAEPVMPLACSAFFATKNAILAARKDSLREIMEGIGKYDSINNPTSTATAEENVDGITLEKSLWFDLQAPLTVERVQQSCIVERILLQ